MHVSVCVLIYCVLIFCITRKKTKQHGSSPCLCFLVLTLHHLCVALWVSTGAALHVSLCTLAECAFGQETQVSGVGLLWIVLWCVWVFMKRKHFQEGAFYSYILCMFHLQIQIRKLFKWTHGFETFVNLAVLCAVCWEMRSYTLSWLQRGNFAENACGHFGIGELLKDLSAGCTVEFAFLGPAKCWHHILPLCLQCMFTYKSFESCYHLLIFKTFPLVCCNSREEVALLKNMSLESLYSILLVNVYILDLTSVLWSYIFADCLVFCAYFFCLLTAGVQKEKKVNLSLQGSNLLQTAAKIPWSLRIHEARCH